MISNSPFSRRSPSCRAYLIARLLIAIALTGAHLEANPTADPDAQFDLKNAKGMEVRLAAYGARITSIKVPDRHGDFADVVLGFDTVEPYRSSLKKPYLGVTLGRYAGRIANGRFTLDGVEHVLAKNSGPNHTTEDSSASTRSSGMPSRPETAWHSTAPRQPVRRGIPEISMSA